MRSAYSFAALAVALVPMSSAYSADLATSGECPGPCLVYEGAFDLKVGWLHPSDSAIGDSYFLLPSSEANLQLKANDSFSVVANIVSEQVIDPVPGRNELFKGLGTYVDVLQAQYDTDNFSVWAGKIHPGFGRAWDVTPGLHGTDLAESYDLAERIGGGASFSFDVGGMANKLQASAFTLDRTVLSQSLFNNRGRATLADAGAGNTKGVSSFAISLDGCVGAETDACYDEGDFGYQLAARYQKGGAGNSGNELGFLGSVNKTFTLTENTKLRLLGESVWFENFDGSADNALVLTGSGALERGPMTYSLAYSQKRTLVSGGADATEHLIDVTVMYDLGDSTSFAGETWSVGAGYSVDFADGQNVQTVGFKLSSALGGQIPFGK